MNTKAMKQRRSFVVIAGSIALLAVDASWVAQAGTSAQQAPKVEDSMMFVHDKDGDDLQTKLFLHRQGVGVQVSRSTGQ